MVHIYSRHLHAWVISGQPVDEVGAALADILQQLRHEGATEIGERQEWFQQQG